MEKYVYILLKINIMNGETIFMEKNTLKEISDLFKDLNIQTTPDKSFINYEKVTKYDYNQKSSLDINTYAKI